MTRLKSRLGALRAGFLWRLSTKTVPNLWSSRLRNRGMRRLGVTMSPDVKFFAGFSVRCPKGLVIEDGASIGPRVLLDARSGRHIGRSAVIAYDAVIWTLNHDYDDLHFCEKGAPVEIGAYAWICSRAVILPGVTVGEGAVVATGAVVTHDVAPYDIVAGVPARVVGHRTPREWAYGYRAGEDLSYFE